MATEVITTRVPAGTTARIDRAAEAEGLQRPEFIRLAIRALLRESEARVSRRGID